MDTNEYKDKIKVLRECYKEASRLTEYHFYIPILQSFSVAQNGGNNPSWEIDYFYKGKEEHIKKEDVLAKISELG